MTEEAERDRIDAIAREWIGTPFHDAAEVKGAGVDCAKLLKCVFREAGLIPDIAIPHYSPQFFLHQPEEQFLGWVLKFAREIPRDQVHHGDVALYKIGLCFGHGAIVVKPGWPKVIHAHYWSRIVREASGTAMHLGMPILDTKFFSYWQR